MSLDALVLDWFSFGFTLMKPPAPDSSEPHCYAGSRTERSCGALQDSNLTDRKGSARSGGYKPLRLLRSRSATKATKATKEQDQLGRRQGRERAVDSTVLPDAVTNLNVVRTSIFSESRGLLLLSREETLLLLRSLEEASGCIPMGLSPGTILQIYCGSVEPAVPYWASKRLCPILCPVFATRNSKPLIT